MEELYRKYRPQSYEDVLGNEVAIKALRKEIENGSHVFLLTGLAGCGKTTLARIASKELGAGLLSIHEINSADNRGIDTAREIMEQMQYAPIDGEAIVWILDEVHQLSSAAQNAFLKALEDTPDYVYFFLCTTDPQKLIAPLKTRCSVVSLKPLNEKDMTFLIKRTARAEKHKVSEDVIASIVSLAGGSARQGLKLLSKVLYLDSEEEMLEALEGGTEDNAECIELCRVLVSNNANWSKISKVLSTMDLSDSEKVRQAVMGYMTAILMKKLHPQAVSALQAFSSADTFRNSRHSIVVACLDFIDLIS